MKWLLALLLVALSACSSGSPKSAPPASSTSGPAPAPANPPATIPTSPPATASTTPPAAGISAAAPCQAAAPPATYQHVVLIVMENWSLGQVVGSPQTPYLNRLGAQCGTATGYSGVSHPSLPNYIALTSGGTQGVTDDAGPSSHRLAAASIFSLLGTGWRSLEESMPSACDHSSGGEYATKHNPAVYYTNIASECLTQDVPMNVAAPDLSARYTFVTPNLCHDGHDCSTATADRWLSTEVPLMLNSAEYRSGSTALFITWDESDAGTSLVPMYVVAPSVRPGTRVGSPLNHYSFLRTSEELLGLSPLLGAAAGAPSMRSAFHL